MIGDGYPANTEVVYEPEIDPGVFRQVDMQVATLETLRATLAGPEVAEPKRRIGFDYYADISGVEHPVRVRQCLAYVGVEGYGLCPAIIRRIDDEQPQMCIRTPDTVLGRFQGQPDQDLGQTGAKEMANALGELYAVLKRYPELCIVDHKLEQITSSTLAV